VGDREWVGELMDELARNLGYVESGFWGVFAALSQVSQVSSLSE
jgi:hypothetical protein